MPVCFYTLVVTALSRLYTESKGAPWDKAEAKHAKYRTVATAGLTHLARMAGERVNLHRPGLPHLFRGQLIPVEAHKLGFSMQKCLK